MATFGGPTTSAKDLWRAFQNNYKLVKVIQKGSFGTFIWLAMDVKLNTPVAAKVMNIKDHSKRRERAREEVRTLTAVNGHPHIIKFLAAYESTDEMVIVTEYAAHGDLLDLVNSTERVGEEEARRLFCQLISALEHMHSLGLCHRDIKTENIFLDKSLNIKLGDFGFAVKFDPKVEMEWHCGTIDYLSPEMTRRHPYRGHEIDTWAAGVVLYLLVVGELPFQGKDHEVSSKIMKLDFTIPDYVSKDCRALIRQILTEPTERLSIADIKKSRWLKNSSVEMIEYLDRKDEAERGFFCKKAMSRTNMLDVTEEQEIIIAQRAMISKKAKSTAVLKGGSTAALARGKSSTSLWSRIKNSLRKSQGV